MRPAGFGPRASSPVAACTACAMRKTSGATAAVAIACGMRQRVERPRHPGVAPEDGEEHEHHDALQEREGAREQDLHPDRLRGQAHARGAREDERRHVRERVEPRPGAIPITSVA